MAARQADVRALGASLRRVAAARAFRQMGVAALLGGLLFAASAGAADLEADASEDCESKNDRRCETMNMTRKLEEHVRDVFERFLEQPPPSHDLTDAVEPRKAMGTICEGRDKRYTCRLPRNSGLMDQFWAVLKNSAVSMLGIPAEPPLEDVLEFTVLESRCPAQPQDSGKIANLKWTSCGQRILVSYRTYPAGTPRFDERFSKSLPRRSIGAAPP